MLAVKDYMLLFWQADLGRPWGKSRWIAWMAPTRSLRGKFLCQYSSGKASFLSCLL